MGRYAFSHEWSEERRRLQMNEALLDAGTIRHLQALGVGPGWRCLEVGAGAGSITRWLCERVGPTGKVVATDLECDFIADFDEKNLEARTHDISSDDLEEEAFDLVHSRMVLQHVPARDQALKRMVMALAPGGVLLEEDMDCASLVASGPGAALFEKVVPPLVEVLEAVGYDPSFGRRLPAALRMQGLVGVAAEGRVPIGVGHDLAAELWKLSVERCRPALVARGEMTDAEIDEALAVHDNEDFAFLYPVIVAAWGQKRLR
jgi:SAM-dependent methyltransferase